VQDHRPLTPSSRLPACAAWCSPSFRFTESEVAAAVADSASASSLLREGVLYLQFPVVLDLLLT